VKTSGISDDDATFRLTGSARARYDGALPSKVDQKGQGGHMPDDKEKGRGRGKEPEDLDLKVKEDKARAQGLMLRDAGWPLLGCNTPPGRRQPQQPGKGKPPKPGGPKSGSR